MWQTLNSKERFLFFLKLAVKNNAKFAINHHSHCFQNEIKPQSQINQMIKQNIKRISPNRLGQYQTRSQDPWLFFWIPGWSDKHIVLVSLLSDLTVLSSLIDRKYFISLGLITYFPEVYGCWNVAKINIFVIHFTCHMKFCFCYILCYMRYIYAKCFLIYLWYIYMYIACFLFL